MYYLNSYVLLKFLGEDQENLEGKGEGEGVREEEEEVAEVVQVATMAAEESVTV